MANELKITINTSANVEGIKKASSTLTELDQSASSASKATDGATASLMGLSSAGGKIVGLLAGAFAFDKLTDSAASFISTAGQFEQYAVTLEVLSGSAAKAQQGFDWIKDFTAKTPYTLSETTEAFIRLKAYGIDATDGSLKTLGDTSSALGKPLMASVEAMADAMTGENERLKEFGITASVSGNKIAYNWINSSGQAKTKVIENNKQIIKSTLEAIFNEKYAGMMDKQSQTLNGMVSNLEDTWTGIKNTIANDSGAFNTAKDAVSGMTSALQGLVDHIDDVTSFGKHILEAGSAVVIYKTAVIGVNTVQKLHAEYMAASTIATTTYSIATNTTTTAIDRLTFSQLALNTAMKANPWLIAGTAAVGLGIVLSNEMDKFNTASKNALSGIKDLQSAESVQKEIDRTVNALEESRKKISDWNWSDSIFGNKAIEEKNAARLENRLKFLGNKLSDLGKESDKTAPKVANALMPLTDKQIAAAKKAVEDLAKAYADINDKIFNINASDHDKAIKSIDDYAIQARKNKIDELTISQYVSEAKAALNRKELKQLGDDMNSSRKELETKFIESDQKTTESILKRWDDGKSALVDYYTSLGNSSDAFYITESDKIQKLAATGVLSNEQLVAVWDKDFAHMRDSSIKLNTVFEDAFKSMEDSMVHMFMTGKFSAEDFFNTVIEGIIRMQIRNSITAPLTEAISGINFGAMFSGIGSSISGNLVGSNGSSYTSSAPAINLTGHWDGGPIPYYSGGAVNNFAFGGYTGDGGKYEPKGVVHGGEYVIPKWQTQRIPAVITQLESMRKRGYADGGLVESALPGTAAPSMPVTINIENKSGTPISADSVSPQFDGRSMVINVVIDAITRNASGMRDVVRSVR